MLLDYTTTNGSGRIVLEAAAPVEDGTAEDDGVVTPETEAPATEAPTEAPATESAVVEEEKGSVGETVATVLIVLAMVAAAAFVFIIEKKNSK